MSFSMEWLIPNRVCLLKVDGTIDRDYLRTMGAIVEAHVEEGIAPVHVILDTTQLTGFPVSVAQLQAFSGWLYHAKTGNLVLIKPAKLVAFLGTIIAGLAHLHLKIAETNADALEQLYRDYPTLEQPS